MLPCSQGVGEDPPTHESDDALQLRFAKALVEGSEMRLSAATGDTVDGIAGKADHGDSFHRREKSQVADRDVGIVPEGED
jgi:hypothetical protein